MAWPGLAWPRRPPNVWRGPTTTCGSLCVACENVALLGGVDGGGSSNSNDDGDDLEANFWFQMRPKLSHQCHRSALSAAAPVERRNLCRCVSRSHLFVSDEKHLAQSMANRCIVIVIGSICSHATFRLISAVAATTSTMMLFVTCCCSNRRRRQRNK